MVRYILNKKRRALVILVLLAFFALPFSGSTPAVAAASACISGSKSPKKYVASVCIAAPANGSVLKTDTTIIATVTVTGKDPGIQHVAFYLNGTPVLEDFNAPYSFTLPISKWVDGAYTLTAEALMRDQYTTPLASIGLTFSTGTTTPPVNSNHFTPTSGTQPAAGQPLTVAVVGDGSGGDPTENAVVNLISSWNPNLLLYLGDIYERGTTAEFYNWYAPGFLYGRFKSITDPTVGNHEYLSGTDAAYVDYWNNVPNYYSFNAGGWHFISLNSNGKYVPNTPTSPQYKWLQQDLASNSLTCVAVYYHHPYLSIGKEGGTAALVNFWKLMAQYHVTLVLNGHDHEYQRWKPLGANGKVNPAGITEIITGTGGHSITPFVRANKRVAVKYSAGTATYGATRLQLFPSSANFMFETTAGVVIDSGTIPCK